ncbi:MAG: hypothetical protein ABIH82_03980 [Candidatus Woesearchaeota archaeon]
MTKKSKSSKINTVCNTCKLNVKAFTLSSGIVFGTGFLLLGWMAGFGWGTEMVSLFSSLYVGYKPGFLGGNYRGIVFFCGWSRGRSFNCLDLQ